MHSGHNGILRNTALCPNTKVGEFSFEKVSCKIQSKVLGVFAIVGCAVAAPQYGQQRVVARPRPFVAQPAQPVAAGVAPRQGSGEAFARILRQDQDTQFDGSFNYAYETENGIVGQATGTLKNPGTEQEAQVIQGSYAYTAPDGTPITINFIADEGGYRAEGDAIPTPPPVPAAIARALEYIRSLPPQPANQQY